MRYKSELGVPAGSSRLPRDFTERRMVLITTTMREALDATEKALRSDLRFEHLAKPEDAVWRFACRCLLKRTGSHASRFVERHARTPQPVDVFYAIEHLTFVGQLYGDDVMFLKKDDTRIPSLMTPFGGRDSYDCVGVVSITGTSTKNIAERGRVSVELALRRLRTALIGASAASKEQLRFRAGPTYATTDMGGRLATTCE
jgi:hypothetical protein